MFAALAPPPTAPTTARRMMSFSSSSLVFSSPSNSRAKASPRASSSSSPLRRAKRCGATRRSRSSRATRTRTRTRASGAAGGAGEDAMTDAIARAHDIAAIASNSSSHDVVRWHSPFGPELQYLAAHPTQTAIVAAMLACVGVFVHVARERVNALKAEFLSDGVDLTRVEDRIDTLQYLKKMHERGMLPLGLEVCAMKQAENEVLFLGPVGVEKWRAYYRERGIDIDGAEDMKRVQKYVRDLHYLEGCLLEVDVESLMLSDGN